LPKSSLLQININNIKNYYSTKQSEPFGFKTFVSDEIYLMNEQNIITGPTIVNENNLSELKAIDISA